MSAEEDREIFEEFVAEARDHLATFEEDVAAMEHRADQGTVPEEAVERAFRSVHTICGAGGFLELEKIVRLSGAMESLLDRLRGNVRACTREIALALRRGGALLRGLIDDPAGRGMEEVRVEAERFERMLDSPEEKGKASEGGPE